MIMSNTEEKPIYLDNHASTPVDPRVVAAVLHAMTVEYGNPNSVDHIFGDMAAKMIVDAQWEIAELIGGEPDGIHFTSGSSEAIQLAITHAVTNRSHRDKPLRIALSTVEHRAVLDVILPYENNGEVTVTWLPVDNLACLDLQALEAACVSGIDLVCVMAANNEVGTIYPIEQIAQIADAVGAATLIDATQAVGRIPIRTVDWVITYLTISGHKMYGPKGVGALVTPPDISIRHSHSRLRSTGDGTPNVPGIVGLGEACRLRRMEMAQDEPRIAAQRDHLEALLLRTISRLVVNGDPSNRLSHNLHLALPDVPNDAVLTRLRKRLAISTGAACTSAVDTPSHVLKAMGLTEDLQNGALRIGIGKFTTDDEIERAAVYLAAAVADTRRVLATR
jgi:cysteine desulfurase